jgi:tRNA threonylcarbamoyladenosine modification (KEOPS) complex Cgi121 subunit
MRGTDSAICFEVKIRAPQAEKELLRLRSGHPKLVIQFVSMKKPIGARAVRMIAMQTLRARKNDALLAEKPEVDLLLRLAGTNQITVALQTHGYKAAGTKLLVAAGPEGQLDALSRALSGDRARPLHEEVELRDVDLDAVETAALLGTRI